VGGGGEAQPGGPEPSPGPILRHVFGYSSDKLDMPAKR
jgi:hypothetical protein